MDKEYIYKKSETYGEYNIYLSLINYFTYNNKIIDCECVEEIVKESIDIKTNIGFSLYENINHRFDVEGVNLHESTTVEEYLNSEILKTLTQKKNTESEIFKLNNGIYYRIDMFEDTPDTTDTWVIINTDNEEVWNAEVVNPTSPYVDIEDWCNNETGEKYIRLKDINPYSLTYGKIIEQLKCY